METAGVMSVTVYDLAEDGTPAAIADNMLVMMPQDDGLMAEKTE